MPIKRRVSDREREDYMNEAQAKLDELDRNVKNLKTKARTVTGKAKLELERQIDEMERKLTEVRHKLKELGSASGEAWKELKAGMDSALDELSKAYGRALAYFQ